MKKFFCAILFCAIYSTSFSQTVCGFDQKMKELMEAGTESRQNILETEQKIRDYIAAHPVSAERSTAVAYVIPVVVHVMHTGGAIGTTYNPTDAAIQNTITYLNAVYAGTYTGLLAPVGSTTPTNLELSFALAKRTSNCGYTNGIDRVNASSITNYTTYGVNVNTSNGCSEITLKSFARWNPSDYYNIWVVNKLDGNDGTSGQFIAGFARFAGGDPLYDGTVMLATTMVAGNKVLPHEIGHAFNLYHPFQGSSLNTSCPANTTCSTDGDAVCDTDPITNNVNSSGVYSFTCRTGTNSCTSTAYTQNTENNFMSYTNCAQVFTAGQKARVQAAMSLPSRVSLGSSLGATSCGASINFSIGSDTKTENNAGTILNCRKYNDYTYQMILGSAPTATATATLTFSGTAVKGIDYDVTTNGNFTTPSNTLSFTAGDTATKNFTVRVYADGIYETTETAVIGFTLNNGGGTAIVGVTNPTFTLTINNIDQDPTPIAGYSRDITFGNIYQISNNEFRPDLTKHRFQILYTKAELNALGIIGPAQMDALQLSVYSKGSTKPYPGFTISMANTTSTSLLFGFESTGFTQVYSSDYSTSSGINRFNFATPFSWDGVSNIAVNFCYDNKIAEPGVAESVIIDLTGSNYYSAFYNGAASANAGCSLSAGNISTHRMYSTLHVFSSGTAISTALNSSSNKYLGPNAEVYFYDASGNIMAKVKNNTAFDYGCTTLTIDRAGTGTSTFWNSTDAKINDLFQKSFKLTPTNTYFASNHSITLYYTNTEVTNWQNITGLPLSSAQMVRIYGSSIPAVTPSNPLYSIVTTNTQTPAVFGTQGYTITIDDVIGTISGIGLGVGLPGNAVAIADFRTKGSGNFGAASIWEYQNTSTSYANALQIPGSSNNITIRQGHTVTMDNNFNLGGSKSLRDSGTLDCKTFIVGGSSGNFFLPAAGTLQIGSADGITTYNNAIGNIQTYGRSFSQDANYVYNGLTSQITGSGLPDSVKNLTLQNNTTLSFSKATTIKNNLILISGNLVLNTNALTLRGPITYGFGILQGSGTSVLNIEGPVGTLKFDQTYPSFYSLFSLNVNAGGSANLGSNLSARSVYINPGSVFTVKTPYTLQAITQ